MYMEEKTQTQCTPGYISKKKEDRRRIPSVRQRVPIDRDVRTIPNPAIQRKVIPYKCDPNVPGFSMSATACIYFGNEANYIDEIVQTAHAELLKNDMTDAEEKYVANYLKRKSDYDNGRAKIHPSVAAGYVIESKVNKRIKNIPNVHLQETKKLKGTRPDILLSCPEGLYGLLDITASMSAGHIFDKKGNWTHHKDIIYVAELTYDSINFMQMTPLQLTPEWEEKLKYIAELKQAQEEEKRELGMQDLINHQTELICAVGQGLILEFGYSSHQLDRNRLWENLRNRFSCFGLDLFYNNGIVNVSKKLGFIESLTFESYSSFDMVRNKEYIIGKIKGGRIFLNSENYQEFYCVFM